MNMSSRLTGFTKKRDILALCFWVNARSALGWVIAGLVGVFFSTFLFLPRFEGEHGIVVQFFAWVGCIAAIVAVIWTVSIPIILLTVIINLARKGCIGPKEYTVTESSISENDGQKVTTADWKNVKGIYKTQRFIFVRYSRRHYFIFNKRDFRNEYEFAQQYATFVKHWIAAQNRPTNGHVTG